MSIPKNVLEKMPTRAAIAKILNLEPTEAERKLGYGKPADCVLSAVFRPNDGNPLYVGVTTIGGRKYRIFPDRAVDVYAEDAPPPQAAVDRAGLLRDAVPTLDADDEDAWTRGGKPTPDALGAAAGLPDVTAAERDAAWEAARPEGPPKEPPE